MRKYDSRITIGYSDRKNAFKGRVLSESGRCESARKVVVKKVKPGKDATVGRTQTNERGRWKVGERNPNGRYYAKVARKSFGGANNTTIVCKPAKSNTIRP